MTCDRRWLGRAVTAAVALALLAGGRLADPTSVLAADPAATSPAGISRAQPASSRTSPAATSPALAARQPLDGSDPVMMTPHYWADLAMKEGARMWPEEQIARAWEKLKEDRQTLVGFCGMVCGAVGDFPRAQALLDQLPPEAEAAREELTSGILRGRIDAGDLPAARQAVEQLDEGPRLRLLACLAEYQARRGDLDDALAIAQRVLPIARRMGTCLEIAARQFRAGQAPHARKTLQAVLALAEAEKAAKKERDRAVGMLCSAAAWAMLGDPAKARAELALIPERARTRNPYTFVVRLLLDAGSVQAARDFLTSVPLPATNPAQRSATNPADRPAANGPPQPNPAEITRLSLIDAYLTLWDTAAALQLAGEIDSPDVKACALSAVAVSLAERGDVPAARDILGRLAPEHPLERARVHLTLVQTLGDQGNARGALAEWDLARKDLDSAGGNSMDSMEDRRELEEDLVTTLAIAGLPGKAMREIDKLCKVPKERAGACITIAARMLDLQDRRAERADRAKTLATR